MISVFHIQNFWILIFFITYSFAVETISWNRMCCRSLYSKTGVPNTRPAGCMWPAKGGNEFRDSLLYQQVRNSNHWMTENVQILSYYELNKTNISNTVARKSLLALNCGLWRLFLAKCGPSMDLSLRPMLWMHVWIYFNSAIVKTWKCRNICS
jgi:hypothetical protein